MKTAQLGEIVVGKAPVTISPTSTVRQAAEAMAAANKGAILVVSDDRLRGIFTERDLLTRVVAARKDPETVAVAEVMTSQLVVGSPSDDFHTGLRRMVSTRCRHLPVVEGDRVVGVVSRRDLMAMDIKTMEQEMDRRDPATLFI